MRVSGNLTLSGATGVAGAFWGLEHLAQQRMGPLIVSHVAWDLWNLPGQPNRLKAGYRQQVLPLAGDSALGTQLAAIIRLK